ncbi:coiled-coil domain-containing protein 97 [Euwallacea similis]|uniref:coiled-coil domain-containing protein 97 n=1 Tax=Euwallacea similis TaxID=1736056 RepID=UPI00344BCFCF
MDIDSTTSNNSDRTVTSEIDNIIRALVLNNEVIFMSQQRGESEPNDGLKTAIATNSFNKNKTNFLLKFGKYLNEKQLQFFDQFALPEMEPADYQEIRLVLDGLKSDHQKNEKNLQIKNRRYKALQKMVKEDCYFSELEMMKRNPLLYEQLVGQYLTKEEKRERDKYEMNADVSLVNILMEGIDRDNAERSRRLEQQKEDSQMEESDSSDEERPVEEISVSLKSARPSTSRWGEFEEHSLHTTKSKKSTPMVTGSERLLLKEEFVATMYENFLIGKDKEFFDYTTIDDNPNYDNVMEMEHDAEDKYFDSEDPEDQTTTNNGRPETAESSEDELDIYMNALNQHPAICELAKNISDRL